MDGTFTRILGPLGGSSSSASMTLTGRGGGWRRAAAGRGQRRWRERQACIEFADGQENVEMHEVVRSGPTLGMGRPDTAVYYKRPGKVYALKTLTKQSILKVDQTTLPR